MTGNSPIRQIRQDFLKHPVISWCGCIRAVVILPVHADCASPISQSNLSAWCARSIISMQEATQKVSEMSCKILNIPQPLNHTTLFNSNPGLIPVSVGSVWWFESNLNLCVSERASRLYADASV